jgi:tetratricopeptide (TPR) repeat protein
MMLARAVVVAAASAIGSSLAVAGEQPAAEGRLHGPPSQMLVMPFDNQDGDARLYWLSEGSSLLLSMLLERYGAMAVARDDRVTAFERLQLPPAVALSHATVIRVSQIVGAADVVVGAYDAAADRLTVRARLIRMAAGRMMPEVVEEGALTDIFGVYDRLARQLLRYPGGPAPPAAPGTMLSSPEAFELYVKGVIAEGPGTDRQYLEQAAAIAPRDDQLRVALWQAHTAAGDHLRALAVATAVGPTSGHARLAAYQRAMSQIALKRHDEAFVTLAALHKAERSAEVLNAMGVVALRRGRTPTMERASSYFRQASQLDPADADYLFNLGYACWLDSDAPGAVAALRDAVRRDPVDADAHAVLSAALRQTGATAEAARELELARRLAGQPDSAAGAPVAPAVPGGMERLKRPLGRSRPHVDAMIGLSGQRDQAALVAFHLDAARRAYAREADREAEQGLRRVLFLSPYLADAHLLLGRVHLRSGRPADAIQAFQVALWSEESAGAYVALAEAYWQAQNLPAAKEAVERALERDPTSVEARALSDRLARPR